jgi:hypothetical protein
MVPSSLMLGVTTHLTTDIAAIPLLWVLPLALYLLTFIISFSRGSERLRGLLGLLAPMAVLLLLFSMLSQITLSVFVQILLHLGVVFVLSLMLHTELAALRPSAKNLTMFFLWVSLGGVIGGSINGLLAPVLFPISIEYMLMLAVGCFFIPNLRKNSSTPEELTEKEKARSGIRVLIDVIIVPSMILLTYLMIALRSNEWAIAFVTWLTGQLNAFMSACNLGLALDRDTTSKFLFSAPLCLLTFFFIDRPHRFALAVFSILFVFYYVQIVNNSYLVNLRSYFGIMQVRTETLDYSVGDEFVEVKSRVLSHGTTMHGRQLQPSTELPDDVPLDTPLSYYHPKGPVGDMYRAMKARTPTGMQVGMIGLGTGSMAGYMQTGESLTYYEIDPKMVELSDSNGTFTFLQTARDRGAKIDVVLGDARLTLSRPTDVKYDLLLIDAFSSDAIPIHLLTKEAMSLYLDRLSADGILAFHVSNRYLNLEPVVAAIATELGLAMKIRSDFANYHSGRTSATWVVLERNAKQLEIDFGKPGNDGQMALLGGGIAVVESQWKVLETMDGIPPWTDDYADVLSVMTSPEVQWLRRQLGFKTPVVD